MVLSVCFRFVCFLSLLITCCVAMLCNGVVGDVILWEIYEFRHVGVGRC